MDLAVALAARDRGAIVGQGHRLRRRKALECRPAELAGVTVAIGVERPTAFPGIDRTGQPAASAIAASTSSIAGSA